MKRKEVEKMKKEKIYIIYNIFKKTNTISIDNISFRDMEKAIEYCESKMNSEELEHRQKMLNRKLINWFEFFTKNYIYYIKEIDLI